MHEEGWSGTPPSVTWKAAPFALTICSDIVHIAALPYRALSSGPGMVLKRLFERRSGNTGGVVRDRRRGDRGDHLEEVILAESRCEESFDVLIAEMSARFDHRLRQARQCGELAVLRQTTITDGLDIRRIDAFLESQSRMERDGPWAVVGHCIGKQDGLDLRFREAATMYVPEQADEAVDQNR